MGTPIPQPSIGKGIDQFHPENKIPDGFWEDVVNGDPTPDGSLTKRKGYQPYAGAIPLRVTSVTHSGTNIDFAVDSSFDLTDLRSTPIVVYGRLSATQSGDFSTTNAAKYYTSFTISSGKIRVTDQTGSATYTDTAPQLTIWGIEWSSAIQHDDAEDRWGWVNHIDTYRSTLESRVVCGLGGNFFAARTYDEVGSTHNFARLHPKIQITLASVSVQYNNTHFNATTNIVSKAGHQLTARSVVQFHTDSTGTLPAGLALTTNYYVIYIDADNFKLASSAANRAAGTAIDFTDVGSGNFIIRQCQVVGPAFWSSSEYPSRTRGFITGTNVSGGYVPVTAVAYNSGTGYVDFTLSITSMTLNGTLSDFISAGVDWLTVRHAPSALVGTHLIRAVSQGADTLTVSCEVDDVSDTRYDDSGLSAQAGIFTDSFIDSAITSGANFVTGDQVISTTLPDELNQEVISSYLDASSHPSFTLGGLSSQYIFTTNETLYGRRTANSAVVTSIGTGELDPKVVRGDVLETLDGRRVRVRNVSIYADTATAVTVVGSGSAATVTLGAGTTTGWSVGDRLTLVGTIQFPSVVTIASIPTSTTFTFTSTVSATESNVIIPQYQVGLDEEITFEGSSDDSTYLQTHARWIPIEWSASTSDTAKTRVQHLDQEDYDDQNFVRSATAQDNMYLTDGEHDVLKFDGTNLSRAGLFRWQPALFATIAPSDIGIVRPEASIAYSAAAGQTLTVAAGSEKLLPEGERVLVRPTAPGTYEEQVLTVADTSTSTAVRVTGDLTYPASGEGIVDSGSGTIHRLVTLKYYARLNLIDANSNIVASAMVQSNDLTVQFGARSAVRLTFLTPPVMGLVDPTNIEISVCRTGGYEGAPPFFRVATIPYSSTANSAQVTIVDNTLAELLIDDTGTAVGELDPLSAISGEELGTSWECPPRAKHIAAAAGRLLLANIKSYPSATVVFRKPPARLTATGADLVGTKFTIRKSSNATTTTNNTDTFVYEMVYDDSAGAAAYATDLTTASGRLENGTNGTTFVVYMASTAAYAAGDWVYLTDSLGRSIDRSPDGYGSEWHGWWQVASLTGTTLTFNKASSPTRRTISAYSTANDTVTIPTTSELTTGDAVFITGSGTLPTATPALAKQTTYYARVVSGTTLSFHTSYAGAIANTSRVDLTVDGSGTLYVNKGDGSSAPALLVNATDPSNVPVLLDAYLNPEADVNYDMLGGSVRSKTTDRFDLVAIRRLADAINSTMRKVDLAQYATFTPFMTAQAGNDFGPGQLVLSAPTAGLSPTCLFTGSALDVYIHGVKRTSGTEVALQTRTFPSRLVRSFKNFPEIFDAPYGSSELDSDSIIDVNPSDGQEIMGIKSFFGDSVSSQSSKEAIVLVFKQFSVHAVNVDTREVKELETNGVGCTYPRSIERTKNGVMFANEDGLWKINRSLELVFMGKYMKRKWLDSVNHDVDDALTPCAVHFGNRYRLSVPVDTDDTNSEVYVYDHTQETNPSGVDPDGGLGSWTRYDNHAATAWTSTGTDCLFGTTAGAVQVLRRFGDETDYRDGADAIDFSATYRIVNLGSDVLRKILEAIVVSFRVVYSMAGTTLKMAVNGTNQWESLDTFEVDPDDFDDNLSDIDRSIVRSLRFSSPIRRASQFQLKIENSTIDEPVELVGMEFVVAGLTERGAETAATSAAD